MTNTSEKEREALQKLFQKLDPKSNYFIIQRGAGDKDFTIMARNTGSYDHRQIRHDAEVIWAFFYAHLPHLTWEVLVQLMKDQCTYDHISKTLRDEIENETHKNTSKGARI